jgi:hypothetical protein
LVSKAKESIEQLKLKRAEEFRRRFLELGRNINSRSPNFGDGFSGIIDCHSLNMLKSTRHEPDQ